MKRTNINRLKTEYGDKDMSRVFVIPDIHLKPWIFDKAEEEMAKGKNNGTII